MKRQPKDPEAYRKYKRALEVKYVNTEHGFVTRLIGGIFSRAQGSKLNNGRRSKGWLPRLTKEGIREIYNTQVEKLGKVFDPTGFSGPAWMKEFTKAPSTLIFDDF